jgi:hypothetical protein
LFRHGAQCDRSALSYLMQGARAAQVEKVK